jgi:hypothetical protein
MSMVRSKWLRPSARMWLRAAVTFGFLGAVSIVMLIAAGESGAQSGDPRLASAFPARAWCTRGP